MTIFSCRSKSEGEVQMRKGAPGAALRDVNRSAVLRVIGHHGPISRADIARRLGVSPGTVTALTRNLIESGIVAPTEHASPNGGRPAELLGLVGSVAVAIGAKIADDHLAVVTADLDGTITANATESFDAVGGNPFAALAELLEPHVRRATDARLLLGLGLGLPGFEDPFGSGVVQAPLLGWRHVPLGEHLARSLGAPVLVDNDVNTLAVAQSHYGIGRGFDHFVTITLGRGVGMGIVVDGELYRGARGAAGEFGHVDVGGDVLCTCGRRGCLETVVAEPALLAAARQRGVLGESATPADLVALAADGQPDALEIYVHAGRVLGLALAAACVVLNPQAIIVAGEGTNAWSYLAPSFHAAFDAGQFPPVRGATPVHVEQWDDARWALGAAALVLRAPFVTPMHDHPAIEQIRGRLDAGFQVPHSLGVDERRTSTWSSAG
jgi:predicted NBD/HSP70 family sugar kinase